MHASQKLGNTFRSRYGLLRTNCNTMSGINGFYILKNVQV